MGKGGTRGWTGEREKRERYISTSSSSPSARRSFDFEGFLRDAITFSRPFVPIAPHAESMRKNGNRAKWICRMERKTRAAAEGEGQGGHGRAGGRIGGRMDGRREGEGEAFHRGGKGKESKRTAAGRGKLAPSRLANIFFFPCVHEG